MRISNWQLTRKLPEGLQSRASLMMDYWDKGAGEHPYCQRKVPSALSVTRGIREIDLAIRGNGGS